MVSRRGFIKIVEVMIAMTLILGALVVVYRSRGSDQRTPDLTEVARDVLREVSSVESLRNEIVTAQATLTASVTNTVAFIDGSLPDYIFFELRRCDVSSACGQSTYRGDVYSAERIISADTLNFDPIKLRLFLWIEE